MNILKKIRLIVVCFLLGFSVNASADIVAISSLDRPAFNHSDLKSLWAGQFPDVQITENRSIEDVFYIVNLSVNMNVFRQTVSKKASRRLINEPVFLNTDIAVVNYVTDHKNAVGYVKRENVTPKVRIIE